MRFRDNSPVSKGGAVVPLKRRYAMSMPDNPTPPPTEPTDPSAAMITFASDWRALAEPSHAAYAQDEPHQREMVAATGVIARRDACTHVAVQDGNWTDSTTWLVVSSGLFGVPGAGDRLGVPSGINVTMNNNTTTVYHSLRVDGKVTWAINQDTKLYIDDTIVINHGGEWLHGTVANPIPAAYTSEVVFPTQTNLDGAKEKLLLQRGFIGMGANSMHPDGKIHIHGASKDHWGTTDQSLSVGATSVVLDAAPTGWEVGDSIHIMATTTKGWAEFSGGRVFSPYQVDNVTITAINTETNTITFTPATTYAHSVQTATGATDLKYYVVNFTRNVKYYSPVDTPLHQRGHWMAMGEGVDVRWASFDWLGRTNKSMTVPSFDATNDTARIAENGGIGDPDFDPTDNVRGRYNFHIHRTGVQLGQAFTQVTGISCTEAEGWLIAHHQSNANFTKCVGRSFLGAGMVAEAGSEAGTWTENYMGGGKQIQGYVSNQADKTEYLASNQSAFDGVTFTRTYGNDFGRLNSAYWFKGRGVKLVGNVSSGTERGRAWMARGGFGDSSLSTVENLPEPRAFYGYEDRAGSVRQDGPVLLISGETVVAHTIPLNVVKASPDQGHNFRTHIHSSDFWQNAEALQFDYTGHYTLDNLRILRSTNGAAIRSGSAISLGSAVSDFYISNNVVQGFTTAVVYQNITDVEFLTYDHGNVVVDNHTTSAPALLSQVGANIPDKTISTKTISAASYSDVDPSWTPSSEPVWPTGTTSWGEDWFVFIGNLTTEFETRNRVHETGTLGVIVSQYDGLASRFGITQLQLMLNKYGYYSYTHPTHGASSYLLVPDLISRKLPATPGADIPVRYLTVPVRLTGVSLGDYTNQGALPTRYVDCIALGDPAITDPGSPAAGAAAYVVYEDIKDVGGLYEGL